MEKAQIRTELRYDGFEQTSRNVRRFSFHWDPAREDCSAISVDADLTHFAKYHVGVQEGPALCVRKVLAEATTGATGAHHAHVHLELLEADIRDYSEAFIQERGRRKSKAGRHAAKAYPAVLVPQSAPNPTDEQKDEVEGEATTEADPASGAGRIL
jgi:hypothetical protein